jgi:hypothetical protein
MLSGPAPAGPPLAKIKTAVAYGLTVAGFIRQRATAVGVPPAKVPDSPAKDRLLLDVVVIK